MRCLVFFPLCRFNFHFLPTSFSHSIHPFLIFKGFFLFFAPPQFLTSVTPSHLHFHSFNLTSRESPLSAVSLSARAEIRYQLHRSSVRTVGGACRGSQWEIDVEIIGSAGWYFDCSRDLKGPSMRAEIHSKVFTRNLASLNLQWQSIWNHAE